MTLLYPHIGTATYYEGKHQSLPLEHVPAGEFSNNCVFSLACQNPSVRPLGPFLLQKAYRTNLSFTDAKESKTNSSSGLMDGIWVRAALALGLLALIVATLVATYKMFIATETSEHSEREEYDDQAVVQFVRAKFGPWQLLFKLVVHLSRFWVVLAIMYWALLHDSGALMDCRVVPNGLVKHMCQYTKACLYGYSVLAANVTLVLTIRILLQQQFYYSMLKHGCVIDFVNLHIMSTPWPWICLLSMLQGGMHFVLKMSLVSGDLGLGDLKVYISAGNKFVLPGVLFMSFFPHFAEVDNSLVSLNSIVEQEYTQRNRSCPWLAKLLAMNARVLSRDVRRHDVCTRTRHEGGKEYISIDDIIDNMKTHYHETHEEWLQRESRKTAITREREWIFRAMWPAAVLAHRRLDWKDTETRQWICVLTIVLSGCIIVSFTSLVVLFSCCTSLGSPLSVSMWQQLFAVGWKAIPTDEMLFNFVLTAHATIVCFFIYKSIWGMFYQQIQKFSPDKTAAGVIFVLLFVIGVTAKEFFSS